jgi:hypothetical protein
MLALEPCGTDLLLDRTDHHFPNPHRPHPNNLPTDNLLVMLHGAPDGRKGRSRDLVGQPGALHQTPDSFHNVSTAQTHVISQIRFLY